jgi:hypothetical protein
MANTIKRPDFSRSKKVAKKALKKNPRKKTKVSRDQKVSSKGSSVFRLVLGLAIVALVFFKPQKRAFSNPQETSTYSRNLSNERGIDQEESSNKDSEYKKIEEEGPRDRTTAIGSVGMDSSQMAAVAKNIYRVANGISEEYEIADGATTAMYILRYFAEIGEFEMSQADILKLVSTFESLIGEQVDEEVIAIINQIRKVKFGKREGRYFSQFYSVQPVRGIVIEINEVSEDPDSSVKEIERFVMEEGSTLFFNDVDTAAEKKQVRDFVKTPVKILGVINLDAIKESLYQVHSDILESIDDYLEWSESPAPAMIVEMRNMYVTVDTATVLKQIKFDFHSAYVFPGINLDGDAVPSLVLGAKAKLLNLKVSIDQ